MKILLTSTSFIDTPGSHKKNLNDTRFIVDTLRGPVKENILLPIISDYDGIICGDDLEIFPNDEIYTYSKSHLTSDVVTFNGHSYHPGVLMAIYEEFKNIEMKNGIWWVK